MDILSFVPRMLKRARQKLLVVRGSLSEMMMRGSPCSTLLPTRTYQTTQKLPLHLLVPSIIFLILHYNNTLVYMALWAVHQHSL